jgi:hypothetical protein
MVWKFFWKKPVDFRPCPSPKKEVRPFLLLFFMRKVFSLSGKKYFYPANYDQKVNKFCSEKSFFHRKQIGKNFCSKFFGKIFQKTLHELGHIYSFWKTKRHICPWEGGVSCQYNRLKHSFFLSYEIQKSLCLYIISFQNDFENIRQSTVSNVIKNTRLPVIMNDKILPIKRNAKKKKKKLNFLENCSKNIFLVSKKLVKNN